MPEPGRYGPPPVPAIDPSPMPAPFPGPAPVPVPVPVPPPSPGPLLGPAVGAWTGTPARSIASAGALTTGATTGGAGAGGPAAAAAAEAWVRAWERAAGVAVFPPAPSARAFADFRHGHRARELARPFSSARAGGCGWRRPPPPPPPPGPGVATNTRRTRSTGFCSAGSVRTAERPDEHHHGEQARVERPPTPRPACRRGERSRAWARTAASRVAAGGPRLQEADRLGRLIQGQEAAATGMMLDSSRIARTSAVETPAARAISRVVNTSGREGPGDMAGPESKGQNTCRGERVSLWL